MKAHIGTLVPEFSILVRFSSPVRTTVEEAAADTASLQVTPKPVL